MRNIDKLIVHCSATPPSMDIGAKEIDRWHRERGWLCIGYHFVIRRNGMLEFGRPVDQIGAHCKGHNKSSIGICMVGGDEDMDTNDFTPEQWDTLAELLGMLKLYHPAAEVLGHHDLNSSKACPSWDVVEWWAMVQGMADGFGNTRTVS